MADNGVIGRDGGLPWRLPDDLRHFKAVTLGKPILMGRRTYESIGHPLPGRRNLVLSRAGMPATPGIECLPDLAQALQRCAADAEVCIIGGGMLYAQCLPLSRRIYLTRVHARIEGDVWFPVPGAEWRETARREHPADERHAYAMSFVTLERRDGQQGRP
jgi:dihydrofolate reductase